MGNGVGVQQRWRSEPDLAERRRQQQASLSSAAAAYPVSNGATAQGTGRRKTKNPVLKAIRAIAKAPDKIGRAARRSQQRPPLPPRAGRPPPPPPTPQVPQQGSTPLGFMPERAFALEQQQAVERQVRQPSSSVLSSSMLTLSAADDRTSSVPAPSGGRYLSQSCSNLMYGQQSSLYPPLNSLNTIEQESGSGSDVDSGEPQTEQPQQAVYSAVDSDHEQESPRIGRDDKVDNEMSLYVDLDEIHGHHHKQDSNTITDPQSEPLSMAVRAAARARTISSLHDFRQAEPSAPPIPSDYTLSRNANCSAATNNQLGDRFVKSVIEKRQVYDDLVSRLSAFVCRSDENDARKKSGAGLAPPMAATTVLLVQQTLKELYYLHAILYGHVAEDMSVDLLPEVGQKAYSFWESLHQVILKHHEELDRADAVCAAEILRNPVAGHLTSVLGEHFKMQRFLLQRQRAERNAELEGVRRTVSANASWAAAAAEEAPAAAAAAGLALAVTQLPQLRCKTTALVSSGSAVVAECDAASAIASSAARAPADRTSASQVGSTVSKAAVASSGVKRALPNEYHKPHVGGAQQSVVALSSVRQAPARSVAPAAVAVPTASIAAAAAAPGCTGSQPTPVSAARTDAGGPHPVEAVYSSLAPASARVQASAATHHLNSPAAVEVRAPSSSVAAVTVGTLSEEAMAARATAAEARELSATMIDRSAHRPQLVSCACQTDDSLSDDVSGGDVSGPSMVSRTTDGAVGEAQRLKAASDQASGDVGDCTVLPVAAPRKSIGAALTATLAALPAPSAGRRSDATVNCSASNDEGSECGRSGTAASAGTTNSDAPPVACSDNPVYMLHSSDSGLAVRSGGSVAVTCAAPKAIGAAEDTLNNLTTVAESDSRSRGRKPLASPRIAALEQGKLALQPKQQNLQPTVTQLPLAAEQSERTDRASIATTSKETKCTKSIALSTPKTVAAQKVQESAVAQLSRPLPPTSADSAFGTSRGADGRAGPVNANPRCQADVEGIAIGVHSSFGGSTAIAAEEQAAFYELIEDTADSYVLMNGAKGVTPKLASLSSPVPSPLASVGGPKTVSPLPPSRSGGSLPVEPFHQGEKEKEPDQQRQQYAAYDAVSECVYANDEERSSTTNKMAIDNAVTSFAEQSSEAVTASAARPAEAAKLQPLSARSVVAEPRLNARSGIGAEPATPPTGEDDDQPVYETMPCDETNKRTIGDAVTSSAVQSAEAATASTARPAEAPKPETPSARSEVVESRFDARSGADAERATSPTGEDDDDQPVYETMPCDEQVTTVGGCGDSQVSVVQRVALKPMEDVLRTSISHQQPQPPPLPRAIVASSSKKDAGAGDKNGRMPAKKKKPAKSLGTTASRYALLTDDDDDDQDNV